MDWVLPRLGSVRSERNQGYAFSSTHYVQSFFLLLVLAKHILIPDLLLAGKAAARLNKFIEQHPELKDK